MGKPTILLSSVTYAMRAQKALERHGMRCRLIKVTAGASIKNCGYGLEINGNMDAALSIVSSAGIHVVDVIR